jgi:hypothetical protein
MRWHNTAVLGIRFHIVGYLMAGFRTPKNRDKMDRTSQFGACLERGFANGWAMHMCISILDVRYC